MNGLLNNYIAWIYEIGDVWMRGGMWMENHVVKILLN